MPTDANFYTPKYDLNPYETMMIQKTFMKMGPHVHLHVSANKQ